MKIKIGKGKFNIQKSKTLIGLKQFSSRSVTTSEKPNTTEKLKHLGGFKVLEVDDQIEDINNKLDELRLEDDVEVGTHIYHLEDSDKALVPTGEIMIVFNIGVDQEEQNLVFDNFNFFDTRIMILVFSFRTLVVFFNSKTSCFLFQDLK